MVEPNQCFPILNRHSQPDVCRHAAIRIPFVHIPSKQRASFGENLKDVPVSLLHRVEDSVNERPRDLFVKEIAHRIYKHATGCPPGQRLQQLMRPKSQIKATLKWMSLHSAKSFGNPLGVAIIA